jgi:hypothetical protein
LFVSVLLKLKEVFLNYVFLPFIYTVKKTIYFYIILAIIFSCGKSNKDNLANNTSDKPLLSVVKKQRNIEPVSAVFLKEVKDWEELKTVNSFLKKFENVSPNEALSNALELRDLAKNLKDSIKPKMFLTNDALNARINVFYNETLRLADLTFISAVTANDIHLQIDKTIQTFSSVHSKINTILLKKKFEEELDVNFNFIGLDSTKIDSLTQKSILIKKEADRLRKQKLKNNIRDEPKNKEDLPKPAQ